MNSKLEQLKALTQVVADTGDIEAIRRFSPQDATTNPSLILKAAKLPHYQELISHIVKSTRPVADKPASIKAASLALATQIGKEISDLVPGKISTEVDARLSFDTLATVAEAREIINRYEQLGLGKERIFIKIAATWEGIRAAELLEKDGIECNLTLLFSLTQAAACAEAGASLISPFVGRILDWHKAKGLEPTSAAEDPGVQSVAAIYGYYKQHNFKTIVMGASFRNTGEIEALAGCDRLTISPDLMAALADDSGHLPCSLSAKQIFAPQARLKLDEAAFRWAMNEDAMATEKLAEGIRTFAVDQTKLEQLLLKFA